MDFLSTLFITSIIGGLVAVDTAACFQFMFSQPIVSCTVTGLIFGQPEIGILAGALLQLPWLINIPSGGTHGSEVNLGAVVASSLSVYFVAQQVNADNIILIVTIIYSLLISRAGAYLVDILRKTNIILAHQADTAAKQGNMRRIEWLNLSGIFYVFLLGFFLSAVGFAAGVVFLKPVMQRIHPDFDQALEMAKYGILGLGFGSAATLLFAKETKWYTLIGAVSAVLGLILWYS